MKYNLNFKHRLSLLFKACLLLGTLISAGSSLAQVEREQVRGVVKAVNEAVLTTDLGVPVLEVPVRTGQSFSAGDTLIRFDCTSQKAEADAVYAAYKGAKARYENQKEMHVLDAAGQYDVVIAKAEMDEANARSRSIRARLKKCDLKAPYNGKVAQHGINAHEVPSTDHPLMKIVGVDALELRLIVPSNWLGWLTIGDEFSFTLDETGTSAKAIVKRMGAEIDAVSRTIPIIAEFVEQPDTVIPGMGGTAQFSSTKG